MWLVEYMSFVTKGIVEGASLVGVGRRNRTCLGVMQSKSLQWRERTCFATPTTNSAGKQKCCAKNQLRWWTLKVLFDSSAETEESYCKVVYPLGQSLMSLDWCLYLSIKSPFACGWYAVVHRQGVPRVHERLRKRGDLNCQLRSVTISLRTSYRTTQVAMKAEATVSAVMSGRGVASGPGSESVNDG